jgi:hypothetical protein
MEEVNSAMTYHKNVYNVTMYPQRTIILKKEKQTVQPKPTYLSIHLDTYLRVYVYIRTHTHIHACTYAYISQITSWLFIEDVNETCTNFMFTLGSYPQDLSL